MRQGNGVRRRPLAGGDGGPAIEPHGGLTAGAARLALLAAILVVGLLVSATDPPRAEAVGKVPPGSVKKLRKASCPPRYAVRVARPTDRKEIRAAKRGRFRIAGVDVKLKRRIDWTYDPLGSPSFRARLHDLRWLDPLFYAYRERGDEQALRKAKRIVVSWVKNNPLRNPTNDRAWFDKVVGDRAAYIAYATRAAKCEGMLKSPRLSRTLLASVLQHMRFLAKPGLYSDTNRGLFMDLGLIFSGRQMKFLPGAVRLIRRGGRRFIRNVKDHVIPGEGMWLEHSTTYQFLTVNAISRYLEVVRRKRPGIKRRLHDMKRVAAWMTMPDRHWLQAGNSYQDKASRPAQKLSRELRGAEILPRSGLAFFRKRKSYLALLSDYHSSIHKHSDDLSFDLADRGHRIISDTGMPNKDGGTPYEFALSPRAHSVVTIDGADFPRDDASAYGSGLLASGEGDGWFAVEATNPLATRQGVTHNRLLLYRPKVALVVVDKLRSNQVHDYRSYFQFGTDFGGLNRTPEGFDLRAGHDRIRVFTESSDPLMGRAATKGQTDPLLGYLYTDFRDRDRRWTVWTNTRGADVDNVTTISIHPKRDVRVTATAPLGDSNVFTMIRNGRPRATLEVIRRGPRLIVRTERLPKPPR